MPAAGGWRVRRQPARRATWRRPRSASRPAPCAISAIDVGSGTTDTPTANDWLAWNVPLRLTWMSCGPCLSSTVPPVVLSSNQTDWIARSKPLITTTSKMVSLPSVMPAALKLKLIRSASGSMTSYGVDAFGK